MPAPSPMTKPARSLSQGREAPLGGAFELVRRGRGDGGGVGSFEAIANREVARAEVDEARGDEERRDATGTAVVQGDGHVGDPGQPADAGADHDSGTLAPRVILGLPTRILDRLH